MQCKVCSKSEAVLHYDKNDKNHMWKCDNCFYGYTDGSVEKVSETKMGWEPYVLEDGPVTKLPKDFPGRFYEDGVHKIRLKDRAHEKLAMEGMDCHFGERGERVQGHDLMLKGRPRVNSKSFSFMGSSRKASTCR